MTAMRDAWADALVELARTDPRIIVVDGDLANSTKADKFALAHPDRFFQMGIAEQNLVGVASGLAAWGYVPWLSSFAVFFTHRALDPIRMLVAQTRANVKIAGSYSGLLTGLTGKTHQDVQDIAIMRAMPSMTVIAPADTAECKECVEWATTHDGPVYLRLARDECSEVTETDGAITNAVKVLRRGSDLAFVSTGVQTARTLEAASLLSAMGIEAALIHVPFLKPLDEDGLLHALADHKLIVTVEEHSMIGGLGGLVAETVAQSANLARVHRIGLADTWGESAPNEFLLDKYGLSAGRVAEAVFRILVGSTVVPSFG